MVCALQKFWQELLGNMHVCFLRGSHGIVVFCEKTSTVKMNCKWLLLFLDYDFLMVYKTGCSHFMVDAFFGF
jgi:hypothetical protein